jgi:hypothetical protein
MSKKNDNKQPVAAAGATDSAAATAVLFAPDKVAATIGRVQWSGRDNPGWALPRRERKDD